VRNLVELRLSDGEVVVREIYQDKYLGGRERRYVIGAWNYG
jgi:hypothetical protein